MTSTLSFSHLHTTQLNATTWCATAQVSKSLCLPFEALKEKPSWLLIAHTSYKNSDKFAKLTWQYHTSPVTISVRKIAHNQRQLQRKGVRLLLEKLLRKLGISDSLDASTFPYRLSSNGYYVCFSHTSGSGNCDSSASKHSMQALNKQLNSHVAVIISRYRPVGIDIENNNVKWQVAKRFYSANEIEVIQSLSTIQRDIITKLLWQIKESFIKIHQYTLAQGLGMDYAYLITGLVEGLADQASVVVISDHSSHYNIAVLSTQQTVVIF